MGEVLHMLARLSSETLVHHADADADVDRFLFRPTTTALDYRTYLARIYGYIGPIEGALAATPELDKVIDLNARAKAGLLLRDMSALGLPLDEIHRLPALTEVPVFRGPAAALGWLYVIERPTLANPVIKGHLETQLHAEVQHASAFLTCYAGQTGTMWRELGRALDTFAQTSAIADRVVLAAHEAFRALKNWRATELQRSPLLRYAG